MGARTAMNHVEIRQSFGRESYEYHHPYGGIAQDSWVTREGFARFFDIPVEYVDQLPTNVKVFDRFWENHEVLGYVMQIGPTKYYRISIVRPKTNQP